MKDSGMLSLGSGGGGWALHTVTRTVKKANLNILNWLEGNSPQTSPLLGAQRGDRSEGGAEKLQVWPCFAKNLRKAMGRRRPRAEHRARGTRSGSSLTFYQILTATVCTRGKGQAEVYGQACQAMAWPLFGDGKTDNLSLEHFHCKQHTGRFFFFNCSVIHCHVHLFCVLATPMTTPFHGHTHDHTFSWPDH